jgi:hypothetical protein
MSYECIFARSKFLRIQTEKEPEFRRWAEELDLEVIVNDERDKKYFRIFPKNNGTENWPTSRNCEEIDLAQELSSFLEDQSVAVLKHAGAKFIGGDPRLILGSAIAVNNKGKIVEIWSSDITKLAAHLGSDFNDDY